jgi:hypothetical protein
MFRGFYKFKRIFKPLLDTGGGFTSETETAARRLQKWNFRYVTVSEVKRLQIYNGYTIFNGHSPTAKILRSGVLTVM